MSGIFHLVFFSNYEGKFASPEMVARRVAKSGDGTHPLSHTHENAVWGYGDKDLNEEDIQELQ